MNILGNDEAQTKMQNSYNLKFRNKATSLRLEKFKTLPGLLLFYDNKVICYKNGESQGFQTLKLELYDVYKIISHSLIFYSMKHNRNYYKLKDLCLSLQESILESCNHVTVHQDHQDHQDHEDTKNLNLDELMQKASEIFLRELHRLVQNFKQTVFNGVWPSPLLVIVAGPSSPRIGHPAMQYFSRLTKKNTTFDEMSLHGICIHSVRPLALEGIEKTKIYDKMAEFKEEVPTDTKIARFLYYVENPQNIIQALEIGLSLYVEETTFSQFKNMNTDILAQVSHDYLNEKCKK